MKHCFVFKKSLFFGRFSRAAHSSQRLPTLAREADASRGALVACLWKLASSGSCVSGSSAGTGSHCLAHSRYPWLAKQARCSQWNRRQMQTGLLSSIPASYARFTSLTRWIQVCGVNESISSALLSSGSALPNCCPCLINLKPSNLAPWEPMFSGGPWI